MSADTERPPRRRCAGRHPAGGRRRLPPLGPRGWLRWTWRQLTSMRTAPCSSSCCSPSPPLPGSTFPQRSINSRAHGSLDRRPPEHAGRSLDRLGFFDVFASPWFAAIYLLLFVSLVGCVLPRSGQHWTRCAAPRRGPRGGSTGCRRTTPGRSTPTWRRPSRPPVPSLRARRYRVAQPRGRHAERREGLPRGDRQPRLPPRALGVSSASPSGTCSAGRATSSSRPARPSPTPSRATTRFTPGPWVDTRRCSRSPSPSTGWTPPSSDDVTGRRPVRRAAQFDGIHDRHGAAPGRRPRRARSRPTTRSTPAAAEVFLLGNGYAPKITVRDGEGRSCSPARCRSCPRTTTTGRSGRSRCRTPRPQQLGLRRACSCRPASSPPPGPTSVFPDSLDPALALTRLEGTPVPGRAAAVGLLPRHLQDDPAEERRRHRRPADLDQAGPDGPAAGGRGSITFEGVQRFAALSIRYDPGKG